MDFEKMYKEALERARRLNVDNMLSNEAIEEIFPELRESEDERIRKELKEAFEAYDIESKWNGIPIRSIFAWLEKQKENPKSADSIPSDCTAGAKCEDRWHKVEDSLPDNPREVLCKDEARNYFIGRYYAGEGWEISNYDDEDKPHHLNPPVSKWIDFPSEKQKEQKPVPFSCGHENGKPTEWDNLQEEFKNINEAFEDGKKEVIDHPDKYGLTKQKTPDPVFSKQEYESYPIISKDTISAKPAELDGKALLHTADKSYQIGFRDGVASVKPAEWSDEDSIAIKVIQMALAQYCTSESQRRDLCRWLDLHCNAYPLPEKLIPHWKPSEEQMEALEKVRHSLHTKELWTENNPVVYAYESLMRDLQKLM